ncbi:MAG: sulfatase-like hydrolase/transferase, partial [Isosphaeraceae bacterium]|nr:sulfatase-like hydrolase/transferase [Isosphaeraceae bacterium]
MRRRLLAIAWCPLALGLATFGLAAARAEEPQRWNVLFIAVDDLNTDLGCYGHPVVKTPNIDRLAARGVRFDRAYCQYPLCNPSRTSFLSGRRPDTTQIFNNGTPPRTSLGDVAFLPEQFRKAGYYTARVGKIAHGAFAQAVSWDLDENAARPGPGAARPAERKARAQAKAARGERGGGVKLSWQATQRSDADEPDGRTARRIAQLLEEHRDGPFFLAAGFHKPHLAWVAPKKYFEMYPPDTIKLPPSLPEDRDD